MNLSTHLQRFAESRYNKLIIHAEFKIQDRYVFTSNRLLRELNDLAFLQDTHVEIINVEYEDFGIPRFILLTYPSKKGFNNELETFFDKCHIEYISAFIKSQF